MKFERDTFIGDELKGDYATRTTGYEFVNIWPSNLTSMRLAYGDSNVLKCNVQFLYDRFFTTFHKEEIGAAPVNTPNGVITSKDAQGFPVFGENFEDINSIKYGGGTVEEHLGYFRNRRTKNNERTFDNFKNY